MPANIIEVSSNGQGFSSSTLGNIAFYSTSTMLMGMSNSSNMMTISSNGVALNSDLTVYNGTLRATNIYSASTMNVSAQSTMTFEINANTGNGNTTYKPRW